jgi:hypothetical protein
MRANFGIFTFILLLFCTSASAQKNITHQSLYWTRYYNQLIFNEKWTWHNEIDNRRFFENNRQHHVIFHTRLHYKFFQNADVGFGFTYSRQSSHAPNSVSQLVVPERRLVQELNVGKQMSNRLAFQQRFRIDERFIHKSNSEKLAEGYDFNFRFRYRLQLSFILGRTDAKNKTTVKLSEELMVNAGKSIILNLFDQNRLFLCVEQGIGKGISAEIGYLHWFQQRPSGIDFFERDIIRFTFYHKINLANN